MRPMEYLQIARTAALTADDKLGKDILILDVRGQSSTTDCFVFVGATSHLHVRSLEDSIRESLKKEGVQLIRTDGQRGHLWRVLDYGTVLIHIMDQKTRDFYAVERLWDSAKKILFLPTASVQKTQKHKKKKAAPKKKSAKAPAKKAKKKTKSK